MRIRTTLLLAALLAACTDIPPSAVPTDALETHREIANACPGLGDGCTSVTDVIDVAAIDIGDSYIESAAGRRYYVSSGTQFLPVVLPPNPVFPNDPMFGRLTAWNALVDSRSNYRSFLAHLRQLPPNPILPPNPVRYQATALTDGTDYFLASLQPVLQ